MKKINEKPIVGIIMGSDSDLPVMQEAATILKELEIPFELTIVSAHRTPQRMYNYAETALERGLQVIIAGAGGAAHLPGMVAAITVLPVIGVPVESKSMKGLDSLYSIVQMPPGVPVATVAINGAKNAALLAVQIIGTSDKKVQQKITLYKKDLETSVLEKAELLEEKPVFKTANLKGFGKKYQGKVRDYYIVGNKRILVTTDRISAFDRVLGFIPYKGQVLNKLSQFWFEHTKDIVQNHLIKVPHPNAMVVKSAELIPLEMVVRGYITGVTGTSIWGSYEKGERTIYGIDFPDGLKKNQKLAKPIVTPTTKAEAGHDERITKDEIIANVVSAELYKEMEKTALALFKRGTEICAKAGIILVDTKYEFGLYKGKLMLIDEMHTPDSSRFWIAKTYLERFQQSLEPENFDKEFLRIWFKEQGYMGDGTPPEMPIQFVNAVSKRYRDVYEQITGEKFIWQEEPIERLGKNAF